MHEMLDNFYVELTPASMSAAHEAMKQVAANWKSGGNKSAPKIRRRALKFKMAARVVQRKVKGIQKGKTAQSNKPKVGKVLKQSKPSVEPIPANYSRSARGQKLIQEQMILLHNLDKNRFPNKPCFAELSGERRLQLLDLVWLLFDCITKSIQLLPTQSSSIRFWEAVWSITEL